RPSSLAEPLNGPAMPNRISLSVTPRMAGPDGGERAATVVCAGADAAGAGGAGAGNAGGGAAVAATGAVPKAGIGGAAPGGSSAVWPADGTCCAAGTPRVALAATLGPAGITSLASL